MKAIWKTRAGSADRLIVTEVPTPAPGPSDVLVRICATSVTRGDVVMRKMPAVVARLVGETPRPVLGNEFAGMVEAVGGDVSSFETGDRVFGTAAGLSQGTHAEYIAVPERGVIARMPEGTSFDQAGVVPVGAMTALHFLKEAKVEPGERVLVNGASGSVGSYAVQLARAMGTHVVGVSSAANVDFVASLGAEEVIDYAAQDFTEADGEYDVVFDVAGTASRKSVAGALSSGGRFTTTQARRVDTVEELRVVRDLMADGLIEAAIDRRYTLEDVPDAHRYVESGGKRGNVLVVAFNEGAEDE